MEIKETIDIKDLVKLMQSLPEKKPNKIEELCSVVGALKTLEYIIRIQNLKLPQSLLSKTTHNLLFCLHDYSTELSINKEPNK